MAWSYGPLIYVMTLPPFGTRNTSRTDVSLRSECSSFGEDGKHVMGWTHRIPHNGEGEQTREIWTIYNMSCSCLFQSSLPHVERIVWCFRRDLHPHLRGLESRRSTFDLRKRPIHRDHTASNPPCQALSKEFVVSRICPFQSRNSRPAYPWLGSRTRRTGCIHDWRRMGRTRYSLRCPQIPSGHVVGG